MQNFEIIAVAFTLITGIVSVLKIGRFPGEYQRRLQLVPAIFRWFHWGTLLALPISSIASLGLGLAGHSVGTMGAMSWLPALYMITWWPIILYTADSPAMQGRRATAAED